jgi:hypothetical protein
MWYDSFAPRRSMLWYLCMQHIIRLRQARVGRVLRVQDRSNQFVWICVALAQDYLIPASSWTLRLRPRKDRTPWCPWFSKRALTVVATL